MKTKTMFVIGAVICGWGAFLVYHGMDALPTWLVWTMGPLCWYLGGVVMLAAAWKFFTRIKKTAVKPARFVAATQIPAPEPRIPIELLLLQIENHVRLEQAAAQSFIDFPNPAVLHRKTTSPLVN